MKIYTIGHGTISIDEFISILKKYDIKCLADVRSYPGSAKFPQFGKVNLSKSLEDNGIKYIHIPDLGGRRTCKTTVHTSIKVKAFSCYAEHMVTSEFKSGYEQLLKIAKTCNTAIMCSETLWWRCHRRMISDRLTYDKWSVYHLGIGDPVLHTVWDVSRLDNNGQIIYDR